MSRKARPPATGRFATRCELEYHIMREYISGSRVVSIAKLCQVNEDTVRKIIKLYTATLEHSEDSSGRLQGQLAA